MIKEFTYNGSWFLPENPEIQIPGVLTFDGKSDGDLELFGSFRNLFLKEEDDTKYKTPLFIHGNTVDGKQITLYNSFEYSRSMFSGIPTSKYSTFYIIIGHHYPSLEDFKFYKIEGKFTNLNRWVNKYGFKIDSGLFESNVDLKYNPPSRIQFKVNDTINGGIVFSYNTPTFQETDKITIEQNTVIGFWSENPIPFSDIMDYLMLFQNFITLGTLQPCHPTFISLHSRKTEKDSEDIDDEIYTTLIYKPGFNFVEENKRRMFLFQYTDIETNFETIIQKWYSLKETISPITNLLLDSFYFKERNRENGFLNIVQSLETYHRRFKTNSVLSKTEHDVKIKSILDSVQNDYKDWLKEKLLFSNEPSLKERLTELINNLPIDTLNELIPDKEKFITDTKNSRNYYTHYNHKLEKKSLKGKHLFVLTEKLKIVLIGTVLIETGFTLEEVNKLFKGKDKYLYQHLYRKENYTP